MAWRTLGAREGSRLRNLGRGAAVSNPNIRIGNAMTKKEHRDKSGHEDDLADNAKDVERESDRHEAALRERPEDRNETARRTTPAGKGRSQ